MLLRAAVSMAPQIFIRRAPSNISLICAGKLIPDVIEGLDKGSIGEKRASGDATNDAFAKPALIIASRAELLRPVRGRRMPCHASAILITMIVSTARAALTVARSCSSGDGTKYTLDGTKYTLPSFA